MCNLDISVFNSVLSSPYRTREAQAALQFWIRLTGPEARDGRVTDALHSTLGCMVPQAAWHLDAVRHSLLSIASTAFVLQARTANMSTELQSTLSKQSIIQMHLAIRSILEENHTSLSTVLSSVMIAMVCGWMGRWEEYKKHLSFSMKLCRELQERGEFVDADMITCIETMFGVVQLLPHTPSSKTKKARMRYAYGVLKSVKTWIDDFIPALEQKNVSEAVTLACQAYRIRVIWILCQWEKHNHHGRNKGNEGSTTVYLEQSPFALALQSTQQWQSRSDDAKFKLRLFTTQMTLALKTTVVYGACGDSERMQDAANAAHARLMMLTGSE